MPTFFRLIQLELICWCLYKCRCENGKSISKSNQNDGDDQFNWHNHRFLFPQLRSLFETWLWILANIHTHIYIPLMSKISRLNNIGNVIVNKHARAKRSIQSSARRWIFVNNKIWWCHLLIFSQLDLGYKWSASVILYEYNKTRSADWIHRSDNKGGYVCEK